MHVIGPALRYRFIVFTACTTPTPCTIGLLRREHCLQSCVACESVNYTIDSKLDFTISMIDYTQELAGLFYSFSYHSQEGSIVFDIWAQVALCKLTEAAQQEAESHLFLPYMVIIE